MKKYPKQWPHNLVIRNFLLLIMGQTKTLNWHFQFHLCHTDFKSSKNIPSRKQRNDQHWKVPEPSRSLGFIKLISSFNFFDLFASVLLMLPPSPDPHFPLSPLKAKMRNHDRQNFTRNKLRRSEEDTLLRQWCLQQRNGLGIFPFRADRSQRCCVGLPLKKAHPKRLETQGWHGLSVVGISWRTKAGDKESRGPRTWQLTRMPYFN